MRNHSLTAVTMLAIPCALILSTIEGRSDPTAPIPPRVLPGVTTDGFVQLPNQWRLRPTGTHVEIGDFPVNIAQHPKGRFLAILHAGFKDHEIVVIDTAGRNRIVSRSSIDEGFYGLCFSPDGSRLYASGGEYEVVHVFDFREGNLLRLPSIKIADLKAKYVVGGLNVSPDGNTLAVCGTWGNGITLVPLNDPGQLRVIPLGPTAKEIPGEATGPSFRDNEGRTKTDATDQCFPYGCLFDPSGQRLFVSLWNKASIAVIDTKENKVLSTWPTEKHPTEMAIRPDGKAIYVACSNSTKVSVLDPATGKPLQTLHCALHPNSPSGNTPNSLTISPDGQLLFVACADANNLALFNIADADEAKPLGFIPTGWYPTSVRFDASTKTIFVANGKGLGSRSNRHGPTPAPGRPATVDEYIAGLMRGSLSAIPLPRPEQMSRLSRLAYACSPLKADGNPVGVRPVDNPIPAKVGDPSPIKYCIYIIKENRTYDQVFGDDPRGNGDPSLCLFPEAITPNHHAITKEFVLLDNIYVDGEVSADGHEWSMGAYATDFVEKSWPLSYRSGSLRKIGYPAEGSYEAIARPAGGYLWDRCAEAGVSYRSYGEWVENGKTPDSPRKASVRALEGHFDPGFHSYDLDYPDQKRADRFISELLRFEKEGGMPRLSIVRLPNDHTYGTRVGKPTPTAMVADNDLALGRVVEAVTKSKFWPETAIFVIEDDAQNGPDHVDAHRVVSLVISPFTKRGFVDSSMYSTSSLLRTIGLILGTKPMSQFDAAALPMYNSFQPAPDLKPFSHRIPKADLGDLNKPNAFGANLSEKFNLAKEDQADDLLFNEVIWRSVKGSNSPMPAPVRAAFVLPRDKDHD